MGFSDLKGGWDLQGFEHRGFRDFGFRAWAFRDFGFRAWAFREFGFRALALGFGGFRFGTRDFPFSVVDLDLTWGFKP